MSTTFPARPSVKTRGRGANSNHSSSTNRPSESGRGIGRTPITRGRGRGVSGAGVGTGARISRGGNSSTNTRMQDNRMNNSQFPGFDEDHSPQRSQRQEPEEESGSQQGQYASGFTVFQPNTRKREQVSEMARRETQEYERYKQENASKHYNYVGTTGGGQMTEDMVRRRQANEVKNQKFNRLQNQQRCREERKEAEQREIDLKRSEARRKAEDNASRGRTANAEDVRRNREGFLRRFESQQMNQ